MAESDSLVDRLAERGWVVGGGVVASLLAGAFVLLLGMAIGGPGMFLYFLFGVVPFLVGALGLARVLWTEPTPTGAAPMEELKRRYAAGDLEDDALERKVETLLEAESGHVPDRETADRDRETADRDGARR